MPSQATKPSTLTTARYKRNLIVTCIVIALAIAGIIGVTLMNAPSESDELPDAVQALIVDDTKTQEVIETINTPEHAREYISSYYKALADKSTSSLQSMGATAAANASERGWLTSLDYKVDLTKLGKPDAKSFPVSQGLYAGCTLYKISDFFSSGTADAIWNNATGLTGTEGWIYYDPINVKWVIADPTIPTGFASPNSSKVARDSANGSVAVTMEDAGVWSSPWWAWSEAQITITNKSDASVTVSVVSYDDGFTSIVPDTLRGTIAPPEGGHETVVSERCVMYRGKLQGFGIEKIGARPLEVDGNICPISIAVGDENIAPIFAVGKADATVIATEIQEGQIEEYGATNDFTDYAPQDSSTTATATASSSNSNSQASNGNANR